MVYSNYYKIKVVSCEIGDFIETHLCKLCGIRRSCMKQNKDAVWSLVLPLVTGVRADPKYSYTYDIICLYVRIVTFDFSLKYVFGCFSRYVGTLAVVGTRSVRFFFGFLNMRRNTCRTDFVRYQAKT